MREKGNLKYVLNSEIKFACGMWGQVEPSLRVCDANVVFFQRENTMVYD